jgi:hypothetical protein
MSYSFLGINKISAVQSRPDLLDTLLRLNASTLSGSASVLEDNTIMVFTHRSTQHLHHTTIDETIDETISSVNSISQLSSSKTEEVPEHLSDVYTLFAQLD